MLVREMACITVTIVNTDEVYQVICKQSKLGEASTFVFETKIREWLTVWRENGSLCGE